MKFKFVHFNFECGDGGQQLSNYFYRDSSFYLGFYHIPLLLLDPAAMEEHPEDEEDQSEDRDPPGHRGHHQGRPHGEQDQGRAEGSTRCRSDNDDGEGVELFAEEIWNKEGSGN